MMRRIESGLIRVQRGGAPWVAGRTPATLENREDGDATARLRGVFRCNATAAVLVARPRHRSGFRHRRPAPISKGCRTDSERAHASNRHPANDHAREAKPDLAR